MSDDKNKSYQDGLYNQPYNGRNWDQWVSGNNARGSGENNYYKGPVSSGNAGDLNSPGWDMGNSSGVPIISPKTALVLLALPIILSGVIASVVVIAASVFLALPLVPVLKVAERVMGVENRKGFRAAYVTTLKALSACGIAIAMVNFILHALATYIFHDGFIAILAAYMGHTITFLFYGVPMPFVAVLTAPVFLLPGLAGFAFILRRDYGGVFGGRRGFLKGMLTGLPISVIALALAVMAAALCQDLLNQLAILTP